LFETGEQEIYSSIYEYEHAGWVPGYQSFAIIFSSCNKDENDNTGFITFGANYNIINCITTVTIYVDNTNIGTLTSYTDTISDCGEESNITKELSVGEHSYKIEIRPESGTGCMKISSST